VRRGPLEIAPYPASGGALCGGYNQFFGADALCPSHSGRFAGQPGSVRRICVFRAFRFGRVGAEATRPATSAFRLFRGSILFSVFGSSDSSVVRRSHPLTCPKRVAE
jgi:hypothetical protein